jgi:hypothetical protein
MANPNKTVGEWRRKNPKVRTPAEQAAEFDKDRQRFPDVYAVMDAVSRGEMTPAEGAAAVKKLTA